MEIVDKFIRQARKKPLLTEADQVDPLELGLSTVERFLPHRAPFLFVEKITGIEREKKIVRCERTILNHDPVFQGHFPGAPVYPGVLLVETIAQTCICLINLLAADRKSAEIGEDGPPSVRLVKILETVFVSEVKPGDRLILLGTVLDESDYTSIIAGQIVCGDRICAVSAMEAMSF